jgi:diguanylate cyclase (GGDEF)-like protein/PAS domain S-box-containing protein
LEQSVQSRAPVPATIGQEVPHSWRWVLNEATRVFPPADRRSAFTNAPMGIALTTPAGVLVDANPALCRMLGMAAEVLHGQSVLDLVHPAGQAGAGQAHATLLAEHRQPMRLETRLVHADGEEIPVQVTASWVDGSPAGEPPHLVMIVEDIADRKALEAQLLHRSLHDPLTGLPNRLLFHDRLQHALERGLRADTPTSVLIIDLDDFKTINDTLGHHTGDLVLVAFAERLQTVLRASDTAARLGGDEFGVVCEHTDRAHAELLVGRLRDAFQDPLVVEGTTISVHMSIGIGLAEGGADPAHAHPQVVREADAAMYATKRLQR